MPYCNSMNWTRTLGLTELILIALFVVAYGLFIYRNYKVGRLLHSTTRSVYIKVVLRSITFAVLIMALLGPSFGETKREVREQGKDIYICVDLSESMNCKDVQPSRLERLKASVEQLINTFRADRIGIIVFSSVAYVQCPLTYDHNALQLFAATLKTDQVPDEGTDFGAALSVALDKHLATAKVRGRNQSKVVVLMSDGEDFGDETEESVRLLNKAGIRVFTVGIGTREGGPIPFKGNLLMDNEGQRVITKLNPKDLKGIAGATGGEYYELNQDINQMPRLIAALDKIEGQLREVRKVDIGADKYYYFVLVGLGLLIADVLFTIKIIRL